MQSEPGNVEDDCGIRFIMKRPCQSILTPYMHSGFSEEQLRQIYIALTGSIKEQPLSTDALNYFLKNAIDLFNEDSYALPHFHRRIIKGMSYEKSINSLRESKEIAESVLEES